MRPDLTSLDSTHSVPAIAPVVELADTQDLGSCAARRGGSSPSGSTSLILATERQGWATRAHTRHAGRVTKLRASNKNRVLFPRPSSSAIR